MFLSADFAFRITDWTCCHGPHLYAILRIISRGVSGLATDSPCGVWGPGWTTCLLHDSPLFGSHFIYLLFIASVHGFMHETSDFFKLRPSSSTNGIFRLSVRPSVCLSVRLSHLFDYVPIIVSSWNFQELLPVTEVTSMQKVKVRSQRSRS